MSGLIDQIKDLPLYLVPLFSLVIGLSGSLHCVGMCGGFAYSFNPSHGFISLYHVGRLMGYLSMGLLFHYLGQSILKQFNHNLLMYLAAIFFMMLLIMGLKMIFQQTKILTFSKLANLLSKISLKLSQLTAFYPANLKKFTTGFLSILLPCGFIYSMLIALMAFQNLTVFLISITFFFAGTLPAFYFSKLIIARFLKASFIPHQHFIFGLLFIFLGIHGLVSRSPHFFPKESTQLSNPNSKSSDSPTKCH